MAVLNVAENIVSYDNTAMLGWVKYGYRQFVRLPVRISSLNVMLSGLVEEAIKCELWFISRLKETSIKYRLLFS
jgi:hypothetical protein